MNFGLLQSIATISAVIAFIAIVWWAYSPKNRDRFEQDAQLALDDDLLEPSSRDKDVK